MNPPNKKLLQDSAFIQLWGGKSFFLKPTLLVPIQSDLRTLSLEDYLDDRFKLNRSFSKLITSIQLTIATAHITWSRSTHIHLVETRATNSEKAMLDGGGQSRTIYSQARPLSPHRMMHFGKRRFTQNPLLNLDIEDLSSLQQLREINDYIPDRPARSTEQVNNKYGPSGGYQIYVSPGERQMLEIMLQSKHLWKVCHLSSLLTLIFGVINLLPINHIRFFFATHLAQDSNRTRRQITCFTTLICH